MIIGTIMFITSHYNWILSWLVGDDDAGKVQG